MPRSCKTTCFCDIKMDQGFLYASSFQLTTPKSAAYAQEERPMSDAANLDKGGRERSTDASPTRRRPAATAGPEAMPPRRSPRLMEDLNCNRAASQGIIRARPTVARARKHDHPLGPIAK